MYNIIIQFSITKLINNNNNNSVASVRKRTIPIERPPLVSEVNANFFVDRGKTHSNKIHSEIHMCKHLSDVSLQDGLKWGDALSLLLFTFV
jgi:hypothetical protein